MSTLKVLLIFTAVTLSGHHVGGEGGIRLPDQPEKPDDTQGRAAHGEGRGLLDWIGLGEEQDPYIQKATQQCISGDLADCFKAQALRSFDDFFDKDQYFLSESSRLVRVESQARALSGEPPELGSTPRSDDSEWDALVKYGLRKIERFLRSTALEMQLDDHVTSNGILAPRFLDEIADEVDIIEDKKAPPFIRNKLKKLIIPMLLILKLFKLKLLLFLPLILGLASFKKFLGFMAIIVPGVIGYFKLCKPNLSSPFASHFASPQYSPAGIGLGHYREPEYLNTHGQHYGNGNRYSSAHSSPGSGITFRDPEYGAQDLAYQGWGDYRNTNKDIKAEEKTA